MQKKTLFLLLAVCAFGVAYAQSNKEFTRPLPEKVNTAPIGLATSAGVTIARSVMQL